MKICGGFFKTLVVTIVLSFVITPVSRSTPDLSYHSSCLRQLSAIDRGFSQEGESDLAIVDTENISRALDYFYRGKLFLREHVARVTQMALLIAEHMGLSEGDRELLMHAALLHDFDFLDEKTQDAWHALAIKHKCDRPLMEFVNASKLESRDASKKALEAFYKKYGCEVLRQLKEEYEGQIPPEKLREVIHLIIAARLRDKCSQEELEGLGASVEEALNRAFHHEENAARSLARLMKDSPQLLAGFGLKNEALRRVLPAIECHSYPSHLPAGTPANVVLLTNILKAADSIEATNNRYRGEHMYSRSPDKENLHETFWWLGIALSQGDVTQQVFDAVEAMIIGKNGEMIRVILRARASSSLPMTDLAFIESKRREYLEALKQSV